MQTTEANVLVACCSPRTAQWCHIRRRMQAREEHVDKNLSPLESLCPCRAVKSFAVDGLREKLWEFFRKEVSEEGRAVAELTSTLDKPCVNAHRQFASSILS
jgi:hypothetical protein